MRRLAPSARRTQPVDVAAREEAESPDRPRTDSAVAAAKSLRFGGSTRRSVSPHRRTRRRRLGCCRRAQRRMHGPDWPRPRRSARCSSSGRFRSVKGRVAPAQGFSAAGTARGAGHRALAAAVPRPAARACAGWLRPQQGHQAAAAASLRRGASGAPALRCGREQRRLTAHPAGRIALAGESRRLAAGQRRELRSSPAGHRIVASHVTQSTAGENRTAHALRLCHCIGCVDRQHPPAQSSWSMPALRGPELDHGGSG